MIVSTCQHYTGKNPLPEQDLCFSAIWLKESGYLIQRFTTDFHYPHFLNVFSNALVALVVRFLFHWGTKRRYMDSIFLQSDSGGIFHNRLALLHSLADVPGLVMFSACQQHCSGYTETSKQTIMGRQTNNNGTRTIQSFTLVNPLQLPLMQCMLSERKTYMVQYTCCSSTGLCMQEQSML